MAIHLDLEEQEQLDQLKHFWERWGTLITGVIVLVALGFAGWNLYNYWDRRQAAQSAVLYDEVERAVQAGDASHAERAFQDVREKFGRTVYAQQAGLAAAKLLLDKGNTDGAKAALAWVADKGRDDGLQAVARLRTAAILLDAKAYDEALKQVDASMPAAFAPLAADRKGDILAAQGKSADAVAAYTSAWKGLDSQSEYRRLVEIKLNALGVDPRTSAGAEAKS
ncbi:tetratricopeptide repeat protein [Xylophilus rhododendri]|uniref:Ancillary SecYEG translocon subunit n=1 Tax=Xylophilus rhododendri TaxID=2697032 RepID=A0A857J9S3_9BURK|nr:tetratricopeptide repeat protein [Xylophilus rhododendri]QHJ00771.1 tetratricopeptide repeat protein [Xylophilus rhododendri]